MRPDSNLEPGQSAADDELRALERALEETPKGAIALAGAAVVLTMLGWFLIYAFVFLPRGSVG